MSSGRSGGRGSGGRGSSTGGQGMMHDVKLRSLEQTLARMNEVKEAHNVDLDEAMVLRTHFPEHPIDITETPLFSPRQPNCHHHLGTLAVTAPTQKATA